MVHNVTLHREVRKFLCALLRNETHENKYMRNLKLSGLTKLSTCENYYTQGSIFLLIEYFLCK